MTKVTDTHAIDTALAHLRSALAILDKVEMNVEAALTDHVIQMLETPRVTTRSA
jgi:hypothetical protein